jgi:hypothetical protein
MAWLVESCARGGSGRKGKARKGKARKVPEAVVYGEDSEDTVEVEEEEAVCPACVRRVSRV